MIIGLDFDNTIVSYSEAISFLADDLFDIPHQIERTKLGLRNYLRKEGREEDWVKFQGTLYGPGMEYAVPYPDAIKTIEEIIELGHRVVIISHRTRYPYAGERHDLHKFAREWIDRNISHLELFSTGSSYFLETKADKICKINEVGCDFFVDDLVDLLRDPGFPQLTNRVLFAPDQKVVFEYMQIQTWAGLVSLIANCDR